MFHEAARIEMQSRLTLRHIENTSNQHVDVAGNGELFIQKHPFNFIIPTRALNLLPPI